MSIFKRGNVYWYHFLFNGQHIQESSKQKNAKVARDIESAHRTALAKGEVGIRDRKPLSLSDFLKNEFLPFCETKFKKTKPTTYRYYSYGAATLQESSIGSLDLREITDQHAGQYAAKRKALSPSTVNCGLRTLRRALNLAVEWGKLDRMPKVTLAKGERQRERVLTEMEVKSYLDACPQPWKDAAIVMLGTGMRPGEVFALRWENILLNGSGGLLQVTQGKSRAAKRMLPLVPAVFQALKTRHREQGSPIDGWIFPADTRTGHLESDGLAKQQHALALKNCNPKVKPFEPYCLRHTALTNLGEAGCDAFTLARIAGHSSITITQRYVHPQADAIEHAFAKLPPVINEQSEPAEKKRL
jgi:integrase